SPRPASPRRPRQPPDRDSSSASPAWAPATCSGISAPGDPTTNAVPAPRPNRSTGDSAVAVAAAPAAEASRKRVRGSTARSLRPRGRAPLPRLDVPQVLAEVPQPALEVDGL